MSSSVQGKSLANVHDSLEHLSCTADVYALQKLGGDLAEAGQWKPISPPSVRGWPELVAIVAKPPKGFRSLALIFSATLFTFLLHGDVDECHLHCKLRIQGAVHHVVSAHLPRSKTADSEDVAAEFTHATFQLLHDLRYVDSLTVGVDLNLDLQAPCDGSCRSITRRALVREGGLQSTVPPVNTWYPPASNSRSPFKIVIWIVGGGTGRDSESVLQGERS